MTTEGRVAALWQGYDVTEIVATGVEDLTFVDSKGEMYIL